MTWERQYRQISVPRMHDVKVHFHWSCENGAWRGQRLRAIALGVYGLAEVLFKLWRRR